MAALTSNELYKIITNTSTLSRRPTPDEVVTLKNEVIADNVGIGIPVVGPSEDQRWILGELPETPGHYWVENIQTNERNVAFIDKSIFLGAVNHWGHKMDATHGGIGVIERWLSNWIILDIIEPYKEPSNPENDNTYGMF